MGGAVVKGFTLQKGSRVMAQTAILFGKLSMKLTDVDILVTIHTKAAAIMRKDKATRGLRRFSGQKFARISSMTGHAGFHLQVITIQFETRFVMRKRLEHLRGKCLCTVAVSTGGRGEFRTELLFMNTSMAAYTELFTFVGKLIDCFAILVMARLTGDFRVFAGQREFGRGRVIEFTFFHAAQLKPICSDMAGHTGLS